MERKGVAQPVTLRTETRRRHTDKDVATKVENVATKKGGRAANKSHESRDSVRTLEP